MFQNSVKEFYARHKAGRQVEQSSNGKDSSKDRESSDETSQSFFNDWSKKLHHFIEERKEKSAQQKREKEGLVTAVSYSGHGINSSVGSINGDEESDLIFDDETNKENEIDSKASTPTNECIKTIEEKLSFEVKPCTESSSSSANSVFVEETSANETTNDVYPSSPGEQTNSFQYYLTYFFELYKSWSWTWSRVYYAFSILMLLPAFLFVYTSPLPSFINGLLFGVFLTLLAFGVLFVIVLNSVFIKRKPDTPQSSKKISIESIQYEDTINRKEIFQEWMYEYLLDEANAAANIEGSGNKRKRIRLIYVRLEGTYLRLSIPKGDIKKSKINEDPAKIPFINQRYYEFSKMRNKRLFFWLPKNIRNKKKYLFAKKYPLILEFERNENNVYKTIKLVLFVFTSRGKEEWYQRLRRAMGIREIESENRVEASSDPPSPNEREHHLADYETIRRVQSLSSVSLPPSSSSASLTSKRKNYEQFINQIMNDKILLDNDSPLLWFNALLGRVFFDFLTHKHWSHWAQVKIQRKLSRIKLPYFIQTLTLTSLDLGPSVPRFVSVKKTPAIDDKGLWVDFDVDYSGGLMMTLETKLNLMKLKDQGSLEKELKPIRKQPLTDFVDSDEESIVSSSDEEDTEEGGHTLEDTSKQMFLKFVDKIASSKYFQSATDNKFVKKAMEEVSNTPLVLTVHVLELRGTLSINMPQPPSDRLWYGFREPPHLEIEAKPRLGEHQVSMHQVIEWIEKKLKQLFNKILVIPNMDDIVLQIMMGNVNETSCVSNVP
ncbi:testis-expressed sequence 2 protein-like protein [Dinothrombium tinctorium]|uniref:Testis-expressed sequence 2 protein-like protein n=1 Tax=Dinothrombium tinctorium TaxID=1965070 RepID=A0A3S5WGY5_9ACAR|nr:testis-expressed sequence 2 protein-like protein [Dinothrombium tinctorium]RWS08379.1 testis-expressed sequence 2 protein-like protein [Dinothrombium tinctorium]